MKNPQYILLFIIFGLISCYGPKQAEKALNKAQIYHPEIVAKKSALWYPCSQFKGTSDSSQYKSFIKQLDSLNGLKIDSIYFYNIDTIYHIDTVVKIGQVKKCQDIINQYKTIYQKLPAIHDTVIMVSTAEKYTIQYLESEREQAHKRYDNSMKLNIWLLLALIVSILMHFFKSFKK